MLMKKDANQRWDFDWETRLDFDVRLYGEIGSVEVLDFYYYISIFIF